MQEGLTLLDILIFLGLGWFIFSRFFGQDLPTDKSKKDQKKTGQQQPKVVDMPQPVQKVQRKPQPRRLPKGIDKMSGVELLKAADPTFRQHEFTDGARTAFEVYFNALNDMDEETLEGLVSPKLMLDIDDRFEELQEKDQQLNTKVESIKSAQIADARLAGRTMVADVKYTAKVAEWVEDKDGKVKSGKKTPETYEAVWTWARSIDADDPNWELEAITPLS